MCEQCYTAQIAVKCARASAPANVVAEPIRPSVAHKHTRCDEQEYVSPYFIDGSIGGCCNHF